MELDQDRRLPILNLLPPAQQGKIRSLLGHNPQTAGGMMNPDFISVPPDATVGDALARIRTSGFGLQQIAIVCVVDDAGKLIDTLTLAELVRASADDKVSELVDDFNPSVTPDADVPEVARLMSDYNLVAMPVLDAERRPVGIIAVDDVLELLVPEEWRWRAGVARD
jgi:Mg/Co/Ni transporter MgtE